MMIKRRKRSAPDLIAGMIRSFRFVQIIISNVRKAMLEENIEFNFMKLVKTIIIKMMRHGDKNSNHFLGLYLDAGTNFPLVNSE